MIIIIYFFNYFYYYYYYYYYYHYYYPLLRTSPFESGQFKYVLSPPKFSSAAFWRVYGIIYPTSSVANSIAFYLVDLVRLSSPVFYITLAVNSTPVNKQTLYILTWARHSTKWITLTGSVNTYRDASNRLQFSEPLPENCRLHLGYLKGPF